MYSCAPAPAYNKHLPFLPAYRNVCHCFACSSFCLAATSFPCLATRYQYASFYAIVAEAIRNLMTSGSAFARAQHYLFVNNETATILVAYHVHGK